MDVKDLSSNWRKLQQTLKSKPSAPSTTPKPATKKREASSSAGRDGVKRSRLSSSSAPSSTNNKRARVENRERSFKKRRMSKSDNTAGEVVEGIQNKLSISENGTEKVKSTSITSTKIQTARELVNQGLSPTVEAGKYIAIDCEMVGVGPNPDNDSALARVSVVNFNGDQIYDSYVRPKEMVTDWRTHVSGIAAKHMVEARSLEQVQKDVAKLLDDRVLVGHAIRNDLDALLLSHPKRDIRDTSRHPPYRRFAGGGSPRLKVLASELLGLEIQGAAHSSVEDARATMLLFRKDKEAFDREHGKKWPMRVIVDSEDKGGNGGQKKKRKSKKKKGK